MDRIESVLKELTVQVARLAFAVERATVGSENMCNPCRCCGCVIALGSLPTTCPACRTENAR